MKSKQTTIFKIIMMQKMTLFWKESYTVQSLYWSNNVCEVWEMVPPLVEMKHAGNLGHWH